MYDFVKMAVCDGVFADQLMNNPLLDFNTLVNTKTGTLKDGVYVATYKNLDFTIYPSKRVEIKGSLHKYWNDGLHNWNDFSFRDVQDAIKGLQATFNINPDKTTVHNLEFGLNVNTGFSPDALLSSLITYKKDPFSKMKTRGQGNGKEVYFSQYGIKIYNKGLQYNRPNNILRFEKKVIKMECLRLGQVMLIDLLSPVFFKHCLGQLLASFEELIISDKVNKSAMTKAELKLFDKCINPLSWGGMTKEERYKNRVKFNGIISRHGKRKYLTTTYQLLQEKGHFLTGILNIKKSLFDRSINRLERDSLLSEKLGQFREANINYCGAFSIGDSAKKAFENYENINQFKQVQKKLL